MLKIGVQSRGIINEKVYEQGYKYIRNSGIQCIDYDIIQENFDKYDLNYYRKHKECAEKYGLFFSQVHAPVFKYHMEHIVDNQRSYDLEYIISALKKSIEICKVLESPYLVIHALNIAEKTSKEEEFDINMQLFNAISEHAINHKVVICIENVPLRKYGKMYVGACSNAQTIKKYIEILNNNLKSECFGSCFDIGHANVLRQNFTEELIILGESLKVVHIHDNDGRYDLHQLPYTFTNGIKGQCSTDWNSFLITLRDIGYHGVLSFETYKVFTTMPGIILEDILKTLFKLGKVFSDVILYNERLEKYISYKFIIFGAGKMLDVYMEYFGEKYTPSIIVDNNSKLWGAKRYGIEICNPNILKNIIKNSKMIIIICSSYYEEIIVQLNQMGIKEYELSEEIYRMGGKPS